MDIKSFRSIAIPALGTGNLKYSYLHVARTMVKAVEEYGKAFPNTGIKKVIFVLHESDEECIQVTNFLIRYLHLKTTLGCQIVSTLMYLEKFISYWLDHHESLIPRLLIKTIKYEI